MEVKIVIDNADLEQLVLEKIAEQIAQDITQKYGAGSGLYRRTIQEATRDVIYKDKENIVNRVVEQASREAKNKAVRKLLEIAEKDVDR